MKSIDEKIAQSEAEWQKIRYENRGVRESAEGFLKAAKRGAAKRINLVYGNIRAGLKRNVFISSYDKGKENIVVSLTTTAGRIRYIFLTIYSLVSQTQKPDKIVLWLGKDVYYPQSVISKIKKLGITVRYVKDLGPHTKYHYAFAVFKKDVIITADDDIIYHRDMVKELYETHLKYPGQVVARRVHRMRFDRNRQPVRYKDWIWECRDTEGPSDGLFATGVGGVLYPPSVTTLECWKNTDFLKVCPKADDIWLKFCELSCGIRVCGVKYAGTDRDAQNIRTIRTGLAFGNIDEGMNDGYIKACTQYFGFNGELCERVLGE